MSQSHIPFTLADPDWYDVAWAPHSPLLRTLITPVTPADWSHQVRGPWSVLVPPAPQLPRQGWKLHVAALPGTAADTVALVSRIAARHQVVHKHLRSRELVHATQLKYADTTISGKVVVCYPRVDQLEALCAELEAVLGDRPAPPIAGELRVHRTPIWLRHGGFAEQWGMVDGVWVPTVMEGDVSRADRRGHDAARDDEPDYIRRLRAQADPSAVLDITNPRLLHRSNAGGVYRVQWRGEQSAVLKEARPHSGLDAAGVDSATRLRHEYDVLQRLSDSAISPQPIELIDTRDGTFLVMEDIAAPTVAALVSQRHPVINPAATDTADTYRAWIDVIEQQLDALVSVLEDHHVTHADLQPANLLWTGTRLVAIDFESAILDGRQAATGISTPGVSRAHDKPLSDRDSIGRIHTILINPTAPPSLIHHPELEDELRTAGLADLEGEPASASAPTLDPDSLAHTILQAATVHRSDRLFPSDVTAFDTTSAGTSLLSGASGVVLALDALGIDYPTEWITWIIDHAHTPHMAPGYGYGIHGTASALARLGHPDAAADLLTTHGSYTGDDPSLSTGAAGYALAWQHADHAGVQGAHTYAQQTWEHVGSLVTGDAKNLSEGLFTGWAGVGLALLTSPLPQRDALARRCLELALLNTTGKGPLLIRERGLTWPYLGHGSASIGLLVDSLDPAGSEPELRLLRERVMSSCRAPLVYSAGLLNGRAGLLLTLKHLAPDDPAVVMHEQRLAWQQRDLAVGGTALLGDHGLRASLDLGTGSAGALVAMSAQPWRTLQHILGLQTT